MDLFEFSDKIIDKKNSNLQFCEFYYYLPPKFSNNLLNSTFYSAIWTLDEYYNLNCDVSKIGYQNNNSVRDLLKNARWHGGSKDDSPTYLGLFMNKKEFCLGCNDGGDYFKRKDMKEIWESKKDLNEFHDVDNPKVGYHVGYDFFRYQFDRIHVDNKRGTLYMIKDISNF